MRVFTLVVATAALLFPGPLSAQALETETARLPRRGQLILGQNLEYQFSADGQETALPLAMEYGIADRLEVLVEPVVFTAIRPESARGAAGLGDLEATLTYLTVGESLHRPAIALAAEVKFPTARNRLIGTGKTDFAGYLILSKRLGRFDTHANVSYTVLGRPTGVQVQNVVGGALAIEYRLGSRSELFAEALGATAAAKGESGGENSRTAPEVAGAEVVGSLGVGTHLTEAWFVSLGVSYDNTGAVLLRPGFTIRLH